MRHPAPPAAPPAPGPVPRALRGWPLAASLAAALAATALLPAPVRPAAPESPPDPGAGRAGRDAGPVPGAPRPGPEQPPAPDTAGAPRTPRARDVVILDSPAPARLFPGVPPAELQLYARGSPDGLRPIPFQIDFIGPDGMVVPSHVNRFREKAVYDFAPNPGLPATLQGRTQLLFMAEDAGRRLPGPALPPGCRRGLEIAVQDPVDGAVSWVYLLQPDDPSAGPRCREDYVDYALVPGPHGSRTQEIRSHGVTMGFHDLEKPYVFTDWTVPASAGGDGTDILCTVRIRLRIRFLFFTFDLDPRSHVIPYVLGYSDGPIRVTRRVRSSVEFGGVKVDRLMGSARMETESHYLRDFSFFDGEVSFPGLLKGISRIRAEFTTDFNAGASGMVWTNGRNDAGIGCLVDGRTSPQETRLDTGPYRWARLQGPQGGWANVLEVHNPGIRERMRLAYLDDAAYRDEKEPALLGAWGSTGFSLNRMDRAEEKITWRSYVFSIPAGFTDRDMDALLRQVFHPLQARVETVWGEAPAPGTDPGYSGPGSAISR